MENLDVTSQFGNYEVEFSDFSKFSLENDYTFIIDRKVWDLYKDQSFFKKIKDPILLDISEENKSLKTIETLANKLIESNLTRQGHLLAIGGGITQELVSFTASIYFRGIDWSFIPTTLLSQADSCVGGKNSLNVSGYKNILGTFYPPRKIFILSDFLKTLENDEIISGEIEMLKIHLLSGRDEYQKLKNLSRDELIYNSLKLKKLIVEADEKDENLRWKLNLGHNFGHALEASSKKPIPHGIAVGFGILAGLEIAKEFHHIAKEDYDEISELTKRFLKGYPVPKYDEEAFREAFYRDKKNTTDELQLILCTGIGEVGLFAFPKQEQKNLFNAAFTLRL